MVHRVNDYPMDEPDYKEKNTKEYAAFMEEFYSMGEQILSGRQLYMDFQEATDREIDYIKWSLSHEGKMWLFLQNLKRRGIDFRRIKIPYQYTKKIGMHGIGSGIWVNQKCETSVPGLYAAGDCRGVTGGSGPRAVVSGYEAGLQAAAYVRGLDDPAEDALQNEWRIERVFQQVNHFRKNPEGEHWLSVEKAIRGVLLAFGTMPLTDTKLNHGITLLQNMEDSLNLSAKDPHEVMRCYQVISLLQSAKAILEAARHRDESFGNYIRAHRYSDLKEEKNLPSTTVVYTLVRRDDGKTDFRVHDYRKENRKEHHGKAV